MKRFRIIIIIAAIIIIIGQITLIDFDDPGWSNNMGSYLGVLAMIIVIITALFFMDKKKAG